MTRRQLARVEVLLRRVAWLDRRIANYDPRGNPSHDQAELGALKWALGIVGAADRADVLDELEARRGVNVPTTERG